MNAYRGLAAALAERLAGSVDGVTFAEEPEGFLRAAADEERWEVFPVDEPEVEEEIDPDAYDPPYPAFAVLEALDFVQEFVRYELGRELEEPWAELAEGEIRAGFGERALAPIAV